MTSKTVQKRRKTLARIEIHFQRKKKKSPLVPGIPFFITWTDTSYTGCLQLYAISSQHCFNGAPTQRYFPSVHKIEVFLLSVFVQSAHMIWLKLVSSCLHAYIYIFFFFLGLPFFFFVGRWRSIKPQGFKSIQPIPLAVVRIAAYALGRWVLFGLWHLVMLCVRASFS